MSVEAVERGSTEGSVYLNYSVFFNNFIVSITLNWSIVTKS